MPELTHLVVFSEDAEQFFTTIKNDAEDFNEWLERENHDQPDLEGAREFSRRANDLFMEVKGFERPPRAREVHDLLLEYAGRAREMATLVSYNDQLDPQFYVDLVSIHNENALPRPRARDALDYLMNAHNIAPSLCISFP